MILCVSLCESCWLVDKLIGVLLLTGYLPYETALPPNIERVDAWKKKSLGSTRRCVSAQKSGNLVGRRPFDLFTFSHKSKQLNCVRSHGYANFCVWFDWDGDTHTEFFSVCDDHSGRRWQNKSIIIRYWLKYCQFSFCRLTHAIRAQWPFSHQSHEKRSKAHTHTHGDWRAADWCRIHAVSDMHGLAEPISAQNERDMRCDWCRWHLCYCPILQQTKTSRPHTELHVHFAT